MALAVPLSRFTSQVGGGSAFFVRQHYAHQIINHKPKDKIMTTAQMIGIAGGVLGILLGLLGAAIGFAGAAVGIYFAIKSQKKAQTH